MRRRKTYRKKFSARRPRGTSGALGANASVTQAYLPWVQALGCEEGLPTKIYLRGSMNHECTMNQTSAKEIEYLTIFLDLLLVEPAGAVTGSGKGESTTLLDFSSFMRKWCKIIAARLRVREGRVCHVRRRDSAEHVSPCTR